MKCKPPRYYDKLFEDVAPDYMEVVKEKRKVKAHEKMFDLKELYRKEEYKLESAKKLLRKFESDYVKDYETKEF